MINVAVFLMSESGDEYLYLYSAKTPEDVLENLLKDNYEMETLNICNYMVESNNKDFNKQVKELISKHLEGENDE